MKYLVLFLIGAYQVVVSGLLNQLVGVRGKCRYSPTCSEYAKKSIQEHGIGVGGYRSILRILSCQPFNPNYV